MHDPKPNHKVEVVDQNAILIRFKGRDCHI